MLLTTKRKGALLIAIGTVMIFHDVTAQTARSGDYDENLRNVLMREGVSYEDALALIEEELSTIID